MESPAGYFEEKWQSSRERALAELKDLAKKGQPQPETNWSRIWVFSGPEATFEDKPNVAENGLTGTPYENQTWQRFAEGIRVAKEVTALRLGKKVSEVTIADMKQSGPMIYFNGRDEQNDYIRSLLKSGTAESEWGISADNITLSKNKQIQNTGHQFIDFAEEFKPASDNEKTVFLSDLYHLPRIKHYAETARYGFNTANNVYYPAAQFMAPFDESMAEVKKIFPYEQLGFIDPPKDK